MTTRKQALRPNNPVATVLAPYAAHLNRLAAGYEARPPTHEESPFRSAGRVEGLRMAAGILEQGRAMVLDINAEELLAQAGALDAATDTLARTAAIVSELAAKVGEAVGKSTPVAAAAPSPGVRGEATFGPPRPQLSSPALAGLPVHPAYPLPSNGDTRPPARTLSDPDGVKVEAATRRILAVLALTSPNHVTRAFLAFACGYSPEGGHFRNKLGEVRTAGWLDDVVDQAQQPAMVITPAGMQEYRIQQGRSPIELPEDLLAHFDSKFEMAGRKIMRALAKHYPSGLGVHDLAPLCGYEADGGHFRNKLGEVRTAGICEPHPRVPRATDDFMAAVKWKGGRS